jgi:membrane protein
MKKIFSFFRELVWILRDMLKRMRDSDMRFLVGSLSFSTVISIVPLLAVSMSVFLAYGGFEGLLAKIEPFILQNFVEGSGTQASQYIRTAVARIHSGALGLTGVVAMLFVSTRLFYDMETAVHRVWQIKATRSLFNRWVVYWVVMFIGPLLLAVMLGIMGSKDLTLLKVLPKQTFTLCLVFSAFYLIYKYVPSCLVRTQPALWGALAATLAVWSVKEFYVVLTRKILSYNKVYGSLASIPIFLLWILFLWWIFLGGVALTSVLQQRAQRAATKRRR